MRKKLAAAAVGLGSLGALVLATGSASSHGYISTPPSRQALCAAGTVTNCGDIQYEPQSVEGPKGFPAAGPADGAICSGGNSRFAQLDDPQAWRCSRATAARVTACYDLLTTSPTGRGRVAPAAPTPPHVESDPQMPLDRKQTSGAWTTGSSSATTAGRSGC